MNEPIVEIKDLSFRYDRRLEKETLSAVSFSVKRGEWLAIIGHNGSGKSTLAKLLVGLLEGHTGSLIIDNVEMAEENKWAIRQRIGIVFQNPDNQFVGTTVEDDIAFGLENINMAYEEMKERVDWAIEKAGLSEVRDHDPSRLSGGQKQRVAIAGILALKPSVIVMDEALVMLDPVSRNDLITVLKTLKKEENITIVSITHDMEEAAKADRIVVMEKGMVKEAGFPEQIFQSNPHLEPPFSERLKRELQKRGAEVPNKYMSEKEMVKWLCKSYLMV